MDIQELVDRRIDELQSESLGLARDVPGRERHEENVVDSGESGAAGQTEEFDRTEEKFDPDNVPDHFRELVEAALAEIAGRVMEITERVTEDNASLEKQLLDARLETLRSAEAVMDLALNLRQRFRRYLDGDGASVIPSGPNQRSFRNGYENNKPAAAQDTGVGTRASMHENGVAALFRKTHK